MDILFFLLSLTSLVCLIVGLVKPTAFSRFVKGKIARKKIGLIFGIATFAFFVLFGMTTNTGKINQSINNNQTAQAPSTTINTKVGQKETQKSSIPISTNKTDQQILEENLASIATGRIGGSDMSYRGLQVEKSDLDRPKDTNMITVSVNVKSFLDKNSLLRNTGTLSSSLLRAVYDVSSMKAYDVLVLYYGETTDKYGNKTNDVILTYAIDKTTYSKINWQNFDQLNLCNFLEQEAKASGTLDTGCNVLVNIQ
jgi:hypothetical protein